MANADYPKGLHIADNPSGGVPRVEEFPVTEQAGEIGIGDPCLKISAGTISIAASTGPITGVARGFNEADGTPANKYPGASAAGYTISLSTDPGQEYVCQSNGSAGTLSIEHRGENCNLVGMGAPRAINGQSTCELNASTVATTSTLSVRLVKPCWRVDNDMSDANCDWVVKLNNSTELPGTGV